MPIVIKIAIIEHLKKKIINPEDNQYKLVTSAMKVVNNVIIS